MQERLALGRRSLLYRAHNTVTNVDVALRIFHWIHIDAKSDKRKLQTAAVPLLSLNHKNIVTMSDFSLTDQGKLFAVYELVDGKSLAAELSDAGVMPIQRAASIIAEVCDAVGFAHSKDIFHRDIKPANVLLAASGTAKLTDFVFTDGSDFFNSQTKGQRVDPEFGTIVYWSPEQCMAKTLSPASDLYSVAICLYQMLVAVPPFKGNNSIQTASKHLTEAPRTLAEVRPDLSFSKGVQAFMDKALAKKPDDRFQSAQQFKAALLAAAGHGASA